MIYIFYLAISLFGCQEDFQSIKNVKAETKSEKERTIRLEEEIRSRSIIASGTPPLPDPSRPVEATAAGTEEEWVEVPTSDGGGLERKTRAEAEAAHQLVVGPCPSGDPNKPPETEADRWLLILLNQDEKLLHPRPLKLLMEHNLAYMKPCPPVRVHAPEPTPVLKLERERVVTTPAEVKVEPAPKKAAETALVVRTENAFEGFRETRCVYTFFETPTLVAEKNEMILCHPDLKLQGDAVNSILTVKGSTVTREDLEEAIRKAGHTTITTLFLNNGIKVVCMEGLTHKDLPTCEPTEEVRRAAKARRKKTRSDAPVPVRVAPEIGTHATQRIHERAAEAMQNNGPP